MQNLVIEGYRLSPQQKYLWSLQQGSAIYLAQALIFIDGPLRTEVLSLALQGLVRRHEALRTRFKRLPGMDVPLQVIDEEDTVQCEEVDLSHRQRAEQEAEINSLFDRERAIPFDLASGPAIRFSLIKLSHRRHELMLSVPALCADARSLRNMVDEISQSYQALAQGGEFSGQPVQYIQFSEWQHDLLENDHDERPREFWERARTASQQELILPLEAPLSYGLANDNQAYEPESFSLRLEPQLA